MYNLVIKNNEIEENFEIENDEINDEIKLIRHISRLRDKMSDKKDFTIKTRKNIMLIQFYNPNTELLKAISNLFLDNEIEFQIHFDRVEPSLKVEINDFEEEIDVLIDLRIMLDNIEAY